MTSSTQNNLKRDDLQGIRGLAILAVLGFHFYPNQFPNGYLGVDQFFVLSGFLMCMLLTKSQELPMFSFFTQFYIRRLKRILPLYFLFILCTVIALYTVFPTAAILQNKISAGKAVIFLSNRSPTANEDYFKKLSIALDLFTHTWSLSVEFQFYLLVPFIFLIGRLFKKPFKEIYYSAIAISSFGYHVSSPTSVAFNSVFARIWQFSIGLLAYFIVDNRKDNTILYEPETMHSQAKQSSEENEVARKPESSGKILWLKNIILVATVLIMLVPIELNPLGTRALITIFTALLIVLDVENVLLNPRFMIYIGDISYALYLIHWPIYAYVKLTFEEWNFWTLTAALLLSILVAATLYQTYESWYLKQSNVLVGILVVALFIANLIAINKDEISEQMKKPQNIKLQVHNRNTVQPVIEEPLHGQV